MMRHVTKMLLLVLMVLVTACQTAYGPSGLSGGYKERKLAEGRYIVSFFGNGNTPEQKVWNYWIYRCAELTTLNGYDYFELQPSSEHAAIDAAEAPYRFSMLPDNPFDRMQPAHARTVSTYTITTYSSKAIVQMYKNPVPANTRLLLDAQSIQTMLKPYVTSGGEATPPVRKDILVRAAVEAAIKSNKIKQEDAEKLQGLLNKTM